MKLFDWQDKMLAELLKNKQAHTISFNRNHTGKTRAAYFLHHQVGGVMRLNYTYLSYAKPLWIWGFNSWRESFGCKEDLKLSFMKYKSKCRELELSTSHEF